MAFSYQGQVLIELKQEPNGSYVEFLEKWRKLSPLKSNYRIELHIYTDVWASLSSHGSQNISLKSLSGLVTKLMVMVTRHVKSLISWFPGMLLSRIPSQTFVTYMACWKCYAEIEPSKETMIEGNFFLFCFAEHIKLSKYLEHIQLGLHLVMLALRMFEKVRALCM